jgi:hypothetical protein
MEIIQSISPGNGITLALGLYLFLLGVGVPLWPKGMRGKFWVTFISVFLLLGGSANLMMMAGAPNNPAELALQEIRDEIRPPRQLDDMIRIDDVTSEGNTIIYHITLTTTDPQPLADSMSDSLRGSVCEKQDFQLGLGITVEVRFKDANGTELPPFTIRPSDCKLPPL